MPNTYFQFKKFTVHQDKCAMKVCTDACLFGAWIAEKSTIEDWGVKNILDIGTGTGLLSMMVSQVIATATVDAVEIDAAAAQQAKENFLSVPWKDRLQLIEENIKHFQEKKQYDLIISNPPFFENDLKSPELKRNIALHGVALTLIELITIAEKLLSPTGKFAVLLPMHRSKELESYALQNGLNLHQKTCVRQTEKHNYFRAMLLFGKQKTNMITNEITIKINNNYSEVFVKLLTRYYLNL